MKKFLFQIGIALAFLVSNFPALRAAQPESAQKQLQKLVQKINGKLSDPQKRNEQDLAEELKEFDAILEQHKGEKTDDVAQVLYMKALLYNQVFQKPEKGGKLLEQLAKDFPDSAAAKLLKQQEASRKIQESLAVGSKFPDFIESDLNGKPLSVANYKGKVVLVDFWATWCGPCKIELPNVLATYQKHHANGFEIVGISLDQDVDTLKDFAKQNNMTWQQFFDGQVWQNKLAVKYGVSGIPATYLLDRTGTIIGKDLRGEELEKAVAAALAKK